MPFKKIDYFTKEYLRVNINDANHISQLHAFLADVLLS